MCKTLALTAERRAKVKSAHVAANATPMPTAYFAPSTACRSQMKPGHSRGSPRPTSSAAVLGRRGPKANPNTFWKDTVSPAANVRISGLTASVLMPYSTPVTELIKTNMEKTQATRTASCQYTVDCVLVATRWQAFSANNSVQTVLHEAATNIIRLHHRRQTAFPDADWNPPRCLSKMSGPSDTPKRPPRPVLKTKKPKDQALSNPQTLLIVFCHKKEIPEVTKQLRLMAMAVQSHTRCCTEMRKLSTMLAGLRPREVGVQQGSPSKVEKPSTLTSRNRNWDQLVLAWSPLETLTFVTPLLNMLALSPVAPR
mmetsp:Transcript_103588/g.309469  ORF Transcript_103588/g.309469 Transcript_103588/m.309469 type:complete len:312 (-) Transcript_103588:357-1292(-)